MSLLDRWHSPTPENYKKAMKVCLSLSAAAVVLLNADTLGKAMVPDFTFKLLPVVGVICKNVIIGGLAIAAYCKMQKEEPKP